MSSKNNKKKNPAVKSMDRDVAREFREIRDGSRRVLSPLCADYLRVLVDPKTARKVGVPTLIGGNPGRTKIVTTKAVGKMVTGTAGWGFINMTNPTTYNTTQPVIGIRTVGPYSAYKAGSCSNVNFTHDYLQVTNATQIAGYSDINWTSDAAPSTDGGSLFRLVGMSIEVFPESSFSTQNGSLSLYETPEHMDITETSNMTFATVEGFESSRTIRGTQTGSQSEKIILNWHPRACDNHKTSSASSYAGYPDSYNDFFFSACSNTGFLATTMPTNGLLVVAEAAAGTNFKYIISATWEMKGFNVHEKKARMVDSRGMDLVFNTINAKQLDGFVGRPEHIYESYLGKALDLAGKLGINSKNISGLASSAINSLGGFL